MSPLSRAYKQEVKLAKVVALTIGFLARDTKLGKVQVLELVEEIAHLARKRPQVLYKHVDAILTQYRTQLQPRTREMLYALRTAALEHNAQHLGAVSRAPGVAGATAFGRGSLVRVVAGTTRGRVGRVLTSGYARTRYRTLAGQVYDVATRFLQLANSVEKVPLVRLTPQQIQNEVLLDPADNGGGVGR